MCNKKSSVANINKYPGLHELILLNCGHELMVETQTVYLTDINKILNSESVNIESRVGDIPVTFSGDSGIRMDGLFPHYMSIKSARDISFNVYIKSSHKEEYNATLNNSKTTMEVNNLENILLQVDNSSHNAVEREEIKKILEEFNTKVKSEPVIGLLSKLREKFKEHFSLATPFLVKLFSHFLKHPESFYRI